jgi:hypothetical protein
MASSGRAINDVKAEQLLLAKQSGHQLSNGTLPQAPRQ